MCNANDHRIHLTFNWKHRSTELETDVCDTLSDSPGKRENASYVTTLSESRPVMERDTPKRKEQKYLSLSSGLKPQKL